MRRLLAGFILWLVCSGGTFRAAVPDPEDCPSQRMITGTPATPVSGTVDASLTIASLNVARNGDAERVLADFRRIEALRRADVVLLQEVLHPAGSGHGLTVALAGAFGRHYVFAPADRWEGGALHGLAILSRFPLTDLRSVPLKRFDLRFHNRCRIALSATIDTPAGPLRIVNVHLDTRLNTSERLEQLSPVLQHAQGSTQPCLVGGDFNTADLRWVRRWLGLPWAARQADAVVRTMASAGFATPFVDGGRTHRYLPYKLDWIFTRGPQATTFGVEEVKSSDHKAIWARIPMTISR